MITTVSKKKAVIAVIAPCYNESVIIQETAKKLLEILEKLVFEQIIDRKSTLLFVDDGSNDGTWDLIDKLHNENPEILSGIKLSSRRGQQNALLCGLLTVKGHVDAAVTIDADLQDDPYVIEKMVRKYNDGHEIVYGVRSKRKEDGFLKRITAQGFYSFMLFLGINIVYNHSDFCLLGKNALNALAEYDEVNLFLRGIVPILGYKTGFEYYARVKRAAGKSKYNAGEMLKLAFEGITSFSIRPLRFITLLGVVIFSVSIAIIIYSLSNYFKGNTFSGWAGIMCSLWGIGGLIILSIGIVGEYAGKTYLESKRRPRYHVENCLCGWEKVK
jgi:glycosyltransferase involved in cell wall biosynthesis